MTDPRQILQQANPLGYALVRLFKNSAVVICPTREWQLSSIESVDDVLYRSYEDAERALALFTLGGDNGVP